MSEATTALARPLGRWRRMVLVGALLWWGSILTLLPFGRGINNALRSHNLLTLTVTIGMLLSAAAVAVVLVRLRRVGLMEWRQWRLTSLLLALLVVAAQLWPRPEERWHVVQYGLLGVLVWGAIRLSRWQRPVVAALVVSACGWMDEGVQAFIPERVYDPRDVVLNAAAGASAILIVELGRLAGRPAALAGAPR